MAAPTNTANNTPNEWGDKPSERRGQWHERMRGPTIRQEITKENVEFFRRVLVKSYGCADADIYKSYEVITNENDEDKDNFMILNYMMNCVQNSMPITRIIYSHKIRIPDYMKQQAAQFARAHGGENLLTQG